jgi:hypothetical protein
MSVKATILAAAWGLSWGYLRISFSLFLKSDAGRSRQRRIMHVLPDGWGTRAWHMAAFSGY